MDAAETTDTTAGPVAYQHDPAGVAELALLADQACDGVTHLLDVVGRVRHLAATWTSALDSVAVQEVQHTFAYLLETSDSGSTQPGALLVPIDGPALYPRALRDADGEVRALWAGLADAVSHPIAVARCADIVFTLRLADNHRDSAEKAARAYLAAVGGTLLHTEQSLGLLRAWTLARSVGSTVLEGQVASAMLVMADDVVTRAVDPYAAVPLLEALTAPGRKGQAQPAAAQANALLDRALTTYTESHVITDVAALIRKRSADDPARAEQASRVEITAMLSEADRATEPLTVRFHLNAAASTARRLGILDLEQFAVARLQSAPAINWQTKEFEISIPPFFVDTFMHPYRYAKDWREALTEWCFTDAPSGNYASNQVAARKAVSESLIARLVRVTIYSDNDLPKRTIAGDCEAYKHELAKIEQYSMGYYGGLLANALDLTRVRFGIPSQDDLQKFILGGGTHPALARAFAQALRLYWVGEYAACVHLATPKVEAAVRALLLELNEPVYRTAVGDSSGQFPGLGVLLDRLVENGFDPDWERFLRTFLLSEGDNVRNFVAHGFMQDASRRTAALTLRACALLALITSEDAVQRDSSDVRVALAKPLHGKPRRSWRRRTIDAARSAYLELRR